MGAVVIFCVEMAAAQTTDSFGEAGTFVVSAERLTGLYFDRIDAETNGVQTLQGMDAEGDTKTSRTTFVFLGNDAELTAAGIPRLALDYFVIPSLSVGGSLLLTTRSQDDDDNYVRPAADINRTTDTSETTFAIEPRAGYGRMFTELLGVWARGGITYASNHVEADVEDVGPGGNITTGSSETTIHHWSLSLDGMLVLSPVGHFAFAVGPYLDIPITGDIEIRSQYDGNQINRIDGDVSALSFGLSAGLLGWL